MEAEHKKNQKNLQLNSFANSFDFSCVLLPIISSSANFDFNIAGITERFAIREQPIIPNLSGTNLPTNMK